MKDEIKEILEDLKEHSDSKYVNPLELIDIECKLLLDYITNLQTIEQQYSAILSENAELENKITNLQEENEVLKKCLREPRIKSTGVILDKLPVFDTPPQDRIDKSIEYIEKGNKHFKKNYNEPYEYAFMVNADEIMKILKGKSDE